MIFYRVSYYTDEAGNAGYSWHTTQREARKAQREGIANYGKDAEPPEIEVVEIKPTKTGILAALTEYASHEQNG